MKPLYDALPDFPRVTQEELESLSRKTTPRFQTEGFTDVPEYPTSVTISDMSDTGVENAAKNVAGETTCDYGQVTRVDGMVVGKPTKAIEISQDCKNPPEALVHEEAHLQEKPDACFIPFLKKEAFETDDQIATLEVLAGMALEGDALAQNSLIDMLMHMATDAAKYLALEDPIYRASYNELEQTIYTSPADRKWLAERDETSSHILKEYSYDPLDIMLTAHWYTQDVVSDLLFPHSTVPMTKFGAFLSTIAPTVNVRLDKV